MAFSIELYKNITPNNMCNEPNKVNKVFDEQYKYVVQGNLKMPTSLINPVIIIEYHPISDNDFFHWNYCKISVFDNRYYFITDIKAINQGLWEITCKVDVLMTYAYYIGEIDAFIVRNENTFNESIEDVNRTYESLVNIIEYTPTYAINEDEPPYSQYVPTPPYIEINSGVEHTYNYVINVLKESTNTTSSLTINGIIDENECPSINTNNTSYERGALSYVMNASNFIKLMNRLLQDDNLATYVISASVVPFEIRRHTPSEQLILGNTVIDDVEVYRPLNNICEYVTIANVDTEQMASDLYIERNSYFASSKYTKIDMWLPYCSWISISSNENIFQNNRLAVTYIYDFANGESNVKVISYNNEKTLGADFVRTIYQGTCQLGINIPINTTNAVSINESRHNITRDMRLDNISNGINIAQSLFSGNAMTITSGVISGATNILNTSIKGKDALNQLHERAQGSISSGNNGLYSNQKVVFRITRPNATQNVDSAYRKLYGLPLNEIKKLNTLSGFTTCESFHLDTIRGATLDELNEIESLLKQGVIL